MYKKKKKKVQRRHKKAFCPINFYYPCRLSLSFFRFYYSNAQPHKIPAAIMKSQRTEHRNDENDEDKLQWER